MTLERWGGRFKTLVRVCSVCSNQVPFEESFCPYCECEALFQGLRDADRLLAEAGSSGLNQVKKTSKRDTARQVARENLIVVAESKRRDDRWLGRPSTRTESLGRVEGSERRGRRLRKRRASVLERGRKPYADGSRE
jgi:hypothetical protein